MSASTNRGELFRTYEALAAGAVDVLEKPTGLEPPGQWEAQFLATVKLVSKIRVITHPRGAAGAGGEDDGRDAAPPAARDTGHGIQDRGCRRIHRRTRRDR
ncbi:MAG: hypothetical protein WDN69_29485 [Aliidongia sp.]